MEVASKNPPEYTAEVTAYISEVRLESSATTVGFSEPCPCCGNRKRRCLHPPARSRKKLLVLEPASAPFPSSSPTRPVLLRSESSPLPSSSSRRAGLSLTPSPPPPSPFLRSHSFPSALLGRPADPAFPPNLDLSTEPFCSPPPTVAPPFSHPCPDPAPPTSPPSFLVPAPPDRCLERFNSSESTPSAARTAITCLANDDKKVHDPDGGATVAEWRKEAVRVSVNCECGVVREVVVLQR